MKIPTSKEIPDEGLVLKGNIDVNRSIKQRSLTDMTRFIYTTYVKEAAPGHVIRYQPEQSLLAMINIIVRPDDLLVLCFDPV